MRKLGGGFIPVLLGGFGIAAVLLILLRYPSETPIDVDLQALDAPSTANAGQRLRLAVAPVWAPEHLTEEYQGFAEYLGKRLGRPVQVVRRNTYTEVNDLLRDRSVDLAVICTGALLDARRREIPLTVVASPVCSGETTYRSYIIVRTRSEAKSLADLAGRSFAYTDPISFSGYEFPVWLLLEAGHDPRNFFARTTFTHGHDASIHAVLDSSVDAAAIDSLVYDFEVRAHPGIANTIRIIGQSPPVPICPLVAPRSADSELVASIAAVLLEMHSSAEGRAVLDVLGVDRFSPPGASDTGPAAGISARVRAHLEDQR